MALSNYITNKTEDITLPFLTKVVTHKKIFIKLTSLDFMSKDVPKVVPVEMLLNAFSKSTKLTK